MRIKRLTMQNFGVYSGINSFVFTHDEPVVLIGGMNGRGKTTFLEAVLLSLYGDNSFAYKESKYRSYNKYLQSYVNESDGTFSSYIELEFEIKNGNNTNDVYEIQREWNSKGRNANEKIFVRKNGDFSEFLTNNWPMFIENLIPSALSNFYFFDGEKIAELAVDQNGKQVKESIRSMLGLNVLDTLKNDLEKNIRKLSKIAKGKENVNKLNSLKEARDKKEEKLNKLNKSCEKLEKTIEELNGKNEEYRNQYQIKGGQILEEKEQLIANRNDVINQIKIHENELIDLAASELPFLMVKGLLEEIKLQGEDEHTDLIMSQAIGKIDELFDEFSSLQVANKQGGEEFIQFIKEQMEKNKCEAVYDLSDHALFQVNSLLEGKLEQTSLNTKSMVESKNNLKKQKDDLDNYLEININEKELQELNKKMQENEVKISVNQEKLKIKLEEVEHCQTELNKADLEYRKYVEAYLKDEELMDDVERKIKYENIALNILNEYSLRLQKSKIGILAETITSCYKQLSNKKNLISKIEIEPTTLDIKYISNRNNEVNKDSLSAGEKQLMVISILWALAICSKKALPVIIDTPLSRMDSAHRTTIVSTYFPQASDQTIILSTDTEIDRDYYNLMKNSVGDEFTLVYDDKLKSTSIKNGYFQEVILNDSKAN